MLLQILKAGPKEPQQGRRVNPDGSNFIDSGADSAFGPLARPQ